MSPPRQPRQTNQPLSIPLIGIAVIIVLIAIGVAVGIVVRVGKLVVWGLGGPEG